MGLHQWGLEALDEVVEKAGLAYSGASIVELGLTNLRKSLSHYNLTYARDLFAQRGAKVLTIDLAGKDGAVALDLAKPLPSSIGEYDILINFGTSEHVPNQYKCWRNIHNLCRVGGVMVHSIPVSCPHFATHCFYFYSIGFMETLAAKCGYRKVVPVRSVSNNEQVFAAFWKIRNRPFIGEASFKECGAEPNPRVNCFYASNAVNGIGVP